MSGAQDGRKLFDLVEGTTAQLDPFRLYIEDAPINLTGITVACIVRDVNGDLVTIASGQIEVDPDQSWNATTETGGRGQVYLTPTAAQFTNALSPYRIRWQLTDGAGDVDAGRAAEAEALVLQQIVDHRLVLIGDVGDPAGQTVYILDKIAAIKYNMRIKNKAGEESLFLPIVLEIRFDKEVADSSEVIK